MLLASPSTLVWSGLLALSGSLRFRAVILLLASILIEFASCKRRGNLRDGMNVGTVNRHRNNSGTPARSGDRILYIYWSTVSARSKKGNAAGDCRMTRCRILLRLVLQCIMVERSKVAASDLLFLSGRLAINLCLTSSNAFAQH